jgi:hypothetical protein
MIVAWQQQSLLHCNTGDFEPGGRNWMPVGDNGLFRRFVQPHLSRFRSRLNGFDSETERQFWRANARGGRFSALSAARPRKLPFCVHCGCPEARLSTGHRASGSVHWPSQGCGNPFRSAYEPRNGGSRASQKSCFSQFWNFAWGCFQVSPGGGGTPQPPGSVLSWDSSPRYLADCPLKVAVLVERSAAA